MPRLILAEHMMQCIGISSGQHGPGLLSTSPERSNIFELSHLTATELLSASITVTKCVDGWITAGWSQLFLRREPTLRNDISKYFGRLLRQLVFGHIC